MATEYCTTTHVQEEFKDLTFGTGNSITAARVTRFIQEASAYIDSRIGLVYTTPIDSTASPISTLLIRAVCISIVAERLEPILNVRSPVPKDSQSGRGGKAERTADDVLNDIVAEKLLLSDATKKSSTDGVQSFAVTDGTVAHIFKRDENQW